MIDHYDPHIVTAQDYYPFGMMSRVALPNSGVPYKFGFNGKMNDNEVKGMGNQQDYGMRIYDARVGRFLSVDPLQAKYAGLTPYQFSSNGPIANIDLDGLEKYYYVLKFNDQGKPILHYIGSKDNTVVEDAGPMYYTSDQLAFRDETLVTSPKQRYFVQFSYDTYAVTEALAVPYKANVEAEFSSDPTKLNINEVVASIDKKIVSNENLNQFRQGFAGGLGARSRPDIPRLGRLGSTKSSAHSTISESATSAHNGNNQAAESNGAVPRLSIGAMSRLEYEAASYHGKVDNAVKSKAPVNGQAALDLSVQVKETSPRRVGIDYDTNEFVVFDKTEGNKYHGHVRPWAELHPDMQKALIKSGMADKKGKITKPNHE